MKSILLIKTIIKDAGIHLKQHFFLLFLSEFKTGKWLFLHNEISYI